MSIYTEFLVHAYICLHSKNIVIADELTLSSLNSVKVSMIIPKTILRPMVVIMMKKLMSKKNR